MKLESPHIRINPADKREFVLYCKAEGKEQAAMFADILAFYKQTHRLTIGGGE